MDKEKAADLQVVVDNIISDPTDANIIKDNKALFAYKGQCYRCRMPNQKELFLADKEKNKYKVILMSEGVINKKKLIELLKTQDIDIKAIEDKKLTIEKKMLDVYVDLGSRNTKEDSAISILKEKITNLNEEHKDICYELSSHLTPCLEYQLEDYYLKFLTAFCTDKCENKDSWVSLWSTYEDFEKEDVNVTHLANIYFARLFNKTRTF